MSIWEFISLGIALGTDSFSVSVGIGMNRLRWATIVKLTLLFSLMQVVLFAGGTNIHLLLDEGLQLLSRLELTGAGRGVSPEQAASWLNVVFSLAGAALLAGLGINMLVSTLKGDGADGPPVYYTGRWGLFALAFSVSVDALTAGVGVGMVREVHLVSGAVILGAVIGIMAFLGLSLGRQISRWIGSSAEIAGGLLLVALAVHFFISSGVLD